MEKSKVRTVEKAKPPDLKKENIRVVSIYKGTKTASEAFHSAAVKKILYDKVNIS